MAYWMGMGGLCVYTSAGGWPTQWDQAGARADVAVPCHVAMAYDIVECSATTKEDRISRSSRWSVSAISL